MKTAEDIVKEKGLKIVSVPGDTTVYNALKHMVEEKVGATFVTQKKVIKGIWTERDLMRCTIQDGWDAKTAKIEDHMKTNLRSAKHTDSIYQLMDKFLGLRVRHLPVEKNGEYIGVLSIGDALKESLNDKDNELQKLNKQLNWDYYEEWRWRS